MGNYSRLSAEDLVHHLVSIVFSEKAGIYARKSSQETAEKASITKHKSKEPAGDSFFVVTSIEPKKITFFKPNEGLQLDFARSFELIRKGMLEGDLDSPNPLVRRA